MRCVLVSMSHRGNFRPASCVCPSLTAMSNLTTCVSSTELTRESAKCMSGVPLGASQDLVGGGCCSHAQGGFARDKGQALVKRLFLTLAVLLSSYVPAVGPARPAPLEPIQQRPRPTR